MLGSATEGKNIKISPNKFIFQMFLPLTRGKLSIPATRPREKHSH